MSGWVMVLLTASWSLLTTLRGVAAGAPDRTTRIVLRSRAAPAIAGISGASGWRESEARPETFHPAAFDLRESDREVREGERDLAGERVGDGERYALVGHVHGGEFCRET